MGYYSFKPYVPVAKRIEMALRKIEKLKKKGMSIQPINIVGRKIATTFWGKAWCEHIESFNDYENRLPRGRTYARNGSVCHLAIEQGLITGIVSGSEIYHIKINVKTLETIKWAYITKTCLGTIHSLLDLITGKLSEGVMKVVCDGTNGIFPLLRDINLSCDCPDFAKMCKHVAAVLYAVGSRLDLQPEQLFKLRGVDHKEIIDLKTAIDDVTTTKETKYQHLTEQKLSQIFDIELSNDEIDNNKKITKHKETSPKVFTGIDISNARKKLQLSYVAFAKKIGVSATTVSAWESKGGGQLSLKDKSSKSLNKIFKKQGL